MAYRYSKPSGYNTLSFSGLNSRSYKPFNGFNNGGAYGPGNYSPQIATLTFTGTPADLSQITVPDGPFNSPSSPIRTFTFTWGGAPGPGVIPLVAGGGTAAQAALAALDVLVNQLTYWSSLLTAPTVIRMTSSQPISVGPGLVGAAAITITTVAAALRAVLPARFGKNYAWLANDTVDVPVAPS